MFSALWIWWMVSVFFWLSWEWQIPILPSCPCLCRQHIPLSSMCVIMTKPLLLPHKSYSNQIGKPEHWLFYCIFNPTSSSFHNTILNFLKLRGSFLLPHTHLDLSSPISRAGICAGMSVVQECNNVCWVKLRSEYF